MIITVETGGRGRVGGGETMMKISLLILKKLKI